MKAWVIQNKSKSGMEQVELKTPTVKEGFALVKVISVSLNRRDYYCTVGLYPGIRNNVVLGSDCCGKVVEVGCDGGKEYLDKEVIINPIVKSFSSPVIPSLNYRLLGTPHNGVLSEYILVKYDRMISAPSYLSAQQAACLPLCGITAYNAVVNKGNIQPENNVLVTGIGGGVAQFAAAFCKILNAKVSVSSGNEEKLLKAKKIGYVGYNYKFENYEKSMVSESKDFFDVIIDGAGGDSFNRLLSKLKISGKYIVYGATAGVDVNLNLPSLFFGQYEIKGVTMGSDSDFKNMISFVTKNKMYPIISSEYDFDSATEAFNEMKVHNQFGKIIINL